jgi:hypothetical protein
MGPENLLPTKNSTVRAVRLINCDGIVPVIFDFDSTRNSRSGSFVSSRGIVPLILHSLIAKLLSLKRLVI